MKKNFLVMAFGMVAMLMLTPCISYANNYYQDEDDRGSEVKQTEAEKYAEKKPVIRQAGKGVSFKETSARQLARLDARTSFAETLSAAIVSAAKNVYGELSSFAGDDESGQGVTEGGEKQGTLSKSIANEVIKNTVEVKRNTFYNKRTRRYTVYVCLEYSGEVKDMAHEVVQTVRQRIPQKDRKRIEENLEKYEFEVEKEIEKNRKPIAENENEEE
jgi:hypothetical protein